MESLQAFNEIIANIQWNWYMHVLRETQGPANSSEPFDRIIRAFRLKKSLCLISEFFLSDFTTCSVFL